MGTIVKSEEWNPEWEKGNAASKAGAGVGAVAVLEAAEWAAVENDKR
jgi:hypothetical protein